MAAKSIASVKLLGDAGHLAQGISDRWLKGLWKRNPAMLGMVRDRDGDPWPDLLLWSGEFSGKYITGAAYIYRVTGDEELKADTLEFIHRFLDLTEPECYFGVVPRHLRLTGAGQDAPGLTGMIWDAWSCYHMMEGLLLWHEITGEERLMQAVLAGTDLLYAHFFEGKRSVLSMGSPEMNLSVYHTAAKVFRITGKKKYLRFARQLEQDIQAETPKNWMAAERRKLHFYQCATPRWERLHTVMGAAEMYKGTGDEAYARMLRYIVDSILQTDIHNTGGFSTEEWARNGRFINSSVETCCVIVFNGLCCEYLDITPVRDHGHVLDHLELSYYNAVMGYNSVTGGWCTYSTPMEGVRNASIKENGFQIRPGAPELNCCSANSPRGVGEAVRWMLREENGEVYLNFLGAAEVELSDGGRVRTGGDYPYGNVLTIEIRPGNRFRNLNLRIPGWAEYVQITEAGEKKRFCGAYARIPMEEKEVTVHIPMAIRYLPGQENYKGLCSIYRGPLLFGMREPAGGIRPRIPAAHIARAELRRTDGGVSLVLPGGIRLRDFYHLGQDGRAYQTWFDIFGI
ncbi:MAG: hypothetical protein E7436_02955 [Ruminococcaceae bacterium]|nr:hypothetical protein [Oscillospiraceae bacterium]